MKKPVNKKAKAVLDMKLCLNIKIENTILQKKICENRQRVRIKKYEGKSNIQTENMIRMGLQVCTGRMCISYTHIQLHIDSSPSLNQRVWSCKALDSFPSTQYVISQLREVWCL